MRTHLIRFLAAAAILAPAFIHATERRFTYVYEATTAPKGTVELENWATWKTNHRGGQGGDEFDFRHELEFGVTDRLQVGLYLADWRLVDDAEHDRSARYQDSAVEVIYTLTHPGTDWLGSAIYGEVRVGDRFLELEGKVILQKNFGPWLVAYNATIEAAYEGAHLDEETGEFGETLGISYQVAPQLTMGAEVVHEIEFPNWDGANDSVVYAGPNFSFRQGRVFATVTPLIQLTDLTEEPEFQTRVIIGVNF